MLLPAQVKEVVQDEAVVQTNGHSADDIRNAMLASLRSIDTGAAPFVDGHTPATLKILLTHADGWKAGFSVVEAP